MLCASPAGSKNVACGAAAQRHFDEGTNGAGVGTIGALAVRKGVVGLENGVVIEVQRRGGRHALCTAADCDGQTPQSPPPSKSPLLSHPDWSKPAWSKPAWSKPLWSLNP
ncbi:hypothetical protein GCM10022286_19630 [Gryllotalpicola daejeonensis]|uniref:Uncharacterized protein n=1 Tax=Gryllotalpicola daejeonensis TaxID=993087 RepID=A0ABP7ZKJ2_9MICO